MLVALHADGKSRALTGREGALRLPRLVLDGGGSTRGGVGGEDAVSRCLLDRQCGASEVGEFVGSMDEECLDRCGALASGERDADGDLVEQVVKLGGLAGDQSGGGTCAGGECLPLVPGEATRIPGPEGDPLVKLIEFVGTAGWRNMTRPPSVARSGFTLRR